MKGKWIIFFLSLAAGVAFADTRDFVIEESVERGMDWERMGGEGYFTSFRNGLSPTLGTQFFNAHGYGANNVRGVYKLFDLTFERGRVYEAHFDVGLHDYSGETAYRLPDNLTVGFWADVDETGEFKIEKRILYDGVELEGEHPEPGSWETWKVTFDLRDNVQTLDFESIAGARIGFFFRGRNGSVADGMQPAFGFDNLRIRIKE